MATKTRSKEEFEKVLKEAWEEGNKAIEGMTDGWPCGGAYITAGGNSEIVKLFKKYGEKHGDYYLLNPVIGRLLGGESWSARKSYPKGYHINAPLPLGSGFQNMDMYIALVKAKTAALERNGFKVSWRSYID